MLHVPVSSGKCQFLTHTHSQEGQLEASLRKGRLGLVQSQYAMCHVGLAQCPKDMQAQLRVDVEGDPAPVLANGKRNKMQHLHKGQQGGSSYSSSSCSSNADGVTAGSKEPTFEDMLARATLAVESCGVHEHQSVQHVSEISRPNSTQWKDTDDGGEQAPTPQGQLGSGETSGSSGEAQVQASSREQDAKHQSVGSDSRSCTPLAFHLRDLLKPLHGLRADSGCHEEGGAAAQTWGAGASLNKAESEGHACSKSGAGQNRHAARCSAAQNPLRWFKGGMAPLSLRAAQVCRGSCV